MSYTVGYQFGEYRLDAASRELWRRDRIVTLPYRAFDCLVFLIEQRDRAVGRDELVTAIWGHADVSDAQLGQIVLRARRAVGDDGNTQNAIRTIPRFGYRWVAETHEVAPEEEAEAPAAADDQPASGNEAADRDAVPPAIKPERNFRYLLPVLIVGVALSLLAVLLLSRGDEGASPGPGGTLVLPVAVDAGEDHAWLRLGLMDMIAGRLRSGGVPVPASESMLSMLRVYGDLDSDAEALRAASGADMVVAARIGEVSGGWRLRLVAARGDAPIVAFETEAEDPLSATQQASDRLLLELGRPALADGEDPKLEEILQRAQAALLGNQLEAARAVLESAPEHLQADPRLRYHSARLDVRAGRWPEVRDAMEAMLADGAVEDNPLLHGQVLTTLGVANFNLDDRLAAEEYADAAVAILRDAGDPAELGRALGLRGGARAVQRRYQEAFADFSNARVQLGKAGDRLVMARLDLLMASFEQVRSRLQQARTLLQRGVAELDSLGAVNELAYGLSLLFRVEMAELDYRRAQEVSNRAWTLRARVPDPETRFVMTAERARVLGAQGRLAEAGAVLDALADEPAPPNPWALSLRDWAHARLAWRRGESEPAVHRAQAALERLLPSEHHSLAASLALLRQRALLALDRQREAEAALQAFDAERQFDHTPEPVELTIARAELAAATGKHARADQLFQTAMATAEDHAVPQELVQAGSAYGHYLLDRDRLSEAGTVAGRVAPWADRDYDAALLQVALYQALGPHEAWARGLAQVRELAGQRTVPPELEREPARLRLVPEE